MISSLLGPLLIIVMGYPSSPSINSMYSLHSTGSSLYFLMPRISHFQPFGIYPMVTSSSTLAAYGAIGAGIPPYEIKDIITVVKAYSSAVGVI